MTEPLTDPREMRKAMTLDDLGAMVGDVYAKTRGALRWVEVPRQARPRHYPYRIVSTMNVSHCRGKRARRQAFYSRQRTARALQRIMWARPIDMGEMTRAHLDVMLWGAGALEVSAAGVRRIEPRTMFFGFDGQDVPPPDGSPRDGEIAGMVRTFNIDANTPFVRSFHGEDDAGRVRVVDTYCGPVKRPPEGIPGPVESWELFDYDLHCRVIRPGGLVEDFRRRHSGWERVSIPVPSSPLPL